MLSMIVWLLLTQGIPALAGQGGSISGTVKDAAGIPAAHVRVAAMVRPDSLQDSVSVASFASLTETDDLGRYRLENISPGHYFIVAGRVDLPTYFPGKLEMKDGTDILITAGTLLSGIDFALNDRSTGRMSSGIGSIATAPSGWEIPIRITVEDRGKLPVSSPNGVPKVRLTRVSDGVITDARWDSTSIFMPLAPTSEFQVSLVDIPEGYTLRSITSDSVDLRSNPLKLPPINSAPAAQISLSTSAGNISVQPMQLANLLTVFLTSGPQRTAAISITLTKEVGQATASGVSITGKSNFRIESIDISGKPGMLYSDSTFEFRGIAAGVHNIVGHPLAAIPGHTTTGASIVVGDRDLTGIELEEIVETPLTPSENPTPPIRRAPGQIRLASVHGNVRDEVSGLAVAKGRSTTGSVTVNNDYMPYTINDDGEFVIPHLLPGNYRLNVFVFGYGSYTKSITIGDEDVRVDILVHEIN